MRRLYGYRRSPSTRSPSHRRGRNPFGCAIPTQRSPEPHPCAAPRARTLLRVCRVHPDYYAKGPLPFPTRGWLDPDDRRRLGRTRDPSIPRNRPVAPRARRAIRALLARNGASETASIRNPQTKPQADLAPARAQRPRAPRPRALGRPATDRDPRKRRRYWDSVPEPACILLLRLPNATVPAARSPAARALQQDWGPVGGLSALRGPLPDASFRRRPR